MTLTKVAENAGISISAIEEIVQEKRAPTLSEVKSISKALKVPLSKLLEESSDSNVVSILFRNNKPTNLKQQVAVDKLSFIIEETYRCVIGKIGPDVISVFPRLDNTPQNAEILANIFRKLFVDDDQIRPLNDLALIVSERLNCLLFIVDAGADGGSAWIEGLSYVFVSPRFKPRMLFTLAHEIAHLLIHHNKKSNYLNFDIEDKEVIRMSSKNAVENFANAFAASLLLPARAVGLELRRFRQVQNIKGDNISDIEIINLSYHFNVSFDVAALRCEVLDLIPKGAASSWHETLKKQYNGAEKRAKELGFESRVDIFFPEKVSNNVINAMTEAIADGSVSLGRVSETLGLEMSSILSFNSRSNS
ncbi:MAG: ImmA/IrrE family metallo-endopeptidase [Bacteroidota bacterium]|nr:ImmA/IrrE family metallo-endopeptidase [Bacteroidota bacterium]